MKQQSLSKYCPFRKKNYLVEKLHLFGLKLVKIDL